MIAYKPFKISKGIITFYFYSWDKDRKIGNYNLREYDISTQKTSDLTTLNRETIEDRVIFDVGFVEDTNISDSNKTVKT